MQEKQREQALAEIAYGYMENAQSAQKLSDVFEQDSRRYPNALKEEEEAGRS